MMHKEADVLINKLAAGDLKQPLDATASLIEEGYQAAQFNFRVVGRGMSCGSSFRWYSFESNHESHSSHCSARSKDCIPAFDVSVTQDRSSSIPASRL
jgi:hypothetical protein